MPNILRLAAQSFSLHPTLLCCICISKVSSTGTMNCKTMEAQGEELHSS